MSLCSESQNLMDYEANYVPFIFWILIYHIKPYIPSTRCCDTDKYIIIQGGLINLKSKLCLFSLISQKVPWSQEYKTFFHAQLS